MIEISAVITTHAEGELVIPTIQSCNLSTAMLSQQGVNFDKTIVMDRPSVKTKDIVLKLASEHQYSVIECDFGDQGLVRNHVVNEVAGAYIAFLDGDDLWSENWLLTAYNLSKKMTKIGVVYPEFNWFFEGSNNILLQNDHESSRFDAEALRAVNLWDALCFCPKQVYQKYPFSSRKIDKGYAYEDWNWNRRLSEGGMPQLIAKDTIIFKRRRKGSQGAYAEQRGVVAEPTASCYFDFYE